MTIIGHLLLGACLISPLLVGAQTTESGDSTARNLLMRTFDGREFRSSGEMVQISTRKFGYEYFDEQGRRYVLVPKKRRRPFTPEHEFRLSLGAFPLNGDGGYGWGCCDEWDSPVGGLTDFGAYSEREFTTGAISFSYAYRPLPLLQFGVACSYTGYFLNFLAADNKVVVGYARRHYFAVMPFVRLAWLNRSIVRMYSGAMLGYQLGYMRNQYGDKWCESYLSGQLTLVGITLGRRLFGSAELGVGSLGVVVFGIGYRFDADSKKP